MLRVLLSPRWLARHLLLAVALTTCFLFGRWQLGRAEDRHSVLNWSYAIEWTLFGGFALVWWGWHLRDDLRGLVPPCRPARRPGAPAAGACRAGLPAAGAAGDAGRGPGARRVQPLSG